jgi:DNA mismatch repair protein MutL
LSTRVQRLPPEVAERIAAGEVVDRPSSIVKELLENSLDAQATRIEVELVDGGRELIRITDNGFGMSREDAELSVERHATSKLREWEDLEKLDSFGFRGEALPSVAAVSRFELLTTARGQQVGTRLLMEGPLSQRTEVAAGPEGTRVDVRDLFWNTPARRKFLKSASAETVQIADLVARFALLNPGVGFRLVVNGKEKLFVAAEATPAQRLADFWKIDESDLLPLHGERDGIVVEGMIAKPAQNRRNRSAQVLAVNGRLIRSQTLSQAFTEGFDPLVPRGRHPYIFAQLRLDPSAIDVNIHPTKAEVRFANERGPFRAIYHAIKESLEAETAETMKLGAWESLLEGGEQSPPRSEPVSLAATSPLGADRSSAPRTSSAAISRPAPAWRPSAAPASRVMELYRPPAGQADAEFELEFPLPPAQWPVEQLPLQAPTVQSEPELRYLTSLYRSYLVMEVDKELWVVDQHAAHERIQYERLHRFQIIGPQSQGLVVPLSVALTPAERETIESQAERFAEVGFELELAGDDEVLIKAVPPGLPGGKVAGFFTELLSDLADEGLTTATPVAQYREKLRAMMACKSSIRARENISEPEALRLVSDLMEAERSPYCPHGRPTRIRLDLAALERLFHRS